MLWDDERRASRKCRGTAAHRHFRRARSRMYNGIGLSTARGSGTNGYVQRNMSFVRAQVERRRREEAATGGRRTEYSAPETRKPDKEILAHKQRRDIEVRCVELQDRLEAAGCVRGAHVAEREAAPRRTDRRRRRLLPPPLRRAPHACPLPPPPSFLPLRVQILGGVRHGRRGRPARAPARGPGARHRATLAGCEGDRDPRVGGGQGGRERADAPRVRTACGPRCGRRI